MSNRKLLRNVKTLFFEKTKLVLTYLKQLRPMKLLTGKQDAITQYKQQSTQPKSTQPIIYEAEIVDLHPEPVAEIDFFRCPTAEDIAKAEQELEQTRKLSYWQWLKSVLG